MKKTKKKVVKENYRPLAVQQYKFIQILVKQIDEQSRYIFKLQKQQRKEKEAIRKVIDRRVHGEIFDIWEAFEKVYKAVR